MAFAATTEEALAELFDSTIAAMTPRLSYKGAEAWKPTSRETGQASTTRRFRQVWKLGGIQPGGAVGGRNIECFAELRIRTDYAGDHAQQQFIIIDDFYQLQDTLSALKSATNINGIVLVQGENYEPAEDYDTSTSADVTKIDHVFTVRYIRSISP